MTKYLLFLYLTLQRTLYAEYIPPGPAYQCPSDSAVKFYPCVCITGTDDGLIIRCENTNMASLSVGLNNVHQPIDTLTIADCNIARLYGPIFHGVKVRVMNVIDVPIRWIEPETFWGINSTLKEIYFQNTKLEAFSTEAFSVLGSVVKLRIDGTEISELPEKAFSQLRDLELLSISSGNIRKFQQDTFQGLEKLKSLDLHGNMLSDIPKNCFQGLRNLETLDLSHNNFTRLNPAYFTDLTKMTTVNISHNAVPDFTRGLFARNTVLRIVDLSHNQIKKLDANTMRGMRFLRRILLNDNQINDIGRGTFTSVSRIGVINLARNKLKKVDYQMFNELQLCEVIDLAENQITVVEKLAFKDIYLTKINLSYNAIESVEAGAFENCVNITLLDLSHNKLTQIHKKAFDATTYALELRLEFNEFRNLSHFPFEFMSGLKILNISYNALSVIPKKTFPKLYELYSIDLSHNEITEIDGSVFQNLFSLRALNLSYNSMTGLTGSTFGNIPTLIELDLSYNQLKDVNRGAFSRLSSLRSLTIHHNNMESVFQIPISLLELDISNNKVKKLPSNRVWPSMNSLLKLNMDDNNLEDRLEDGSFSNLLALQQLSLKRNKIPKVPRESLGGISSLQYVFLDGNEISELERSAFGKLPVMFEITMSDNNISEVELKAFEGLLQLLKLDLSGNNITYLKPGVFFGLVSLRSLDLSRNGIERLDNKTHGLLEDCPSLEKVNLSHNRISFITQKTFPENPWIPYKLQEIDLGYNLMPVVTKELNFGTRTIKRLSLRGNILNEIRKGVFGKMVELEDLDLSGNEFTHFQGDELGNVTNLASLNISSNRFVELPREEILRLEHLRYIDASHNRLQEFDDELMPKIENGTVINYEGNPIPCDCRMRPLKRWLDLKASYGVWSHFRCHAPESLRDKSLAEVTQEDLSCSLATSGFIGQQYDLAPDIEFTEISSTSTQIMFSWIVSTRKDISDFRAIIFPSQGARISKDDILSSVPVFDYRSEPIVEKDIGYGLRSSKIEGLDPEKYYVLCIVGRTSSGDLSKLKTRNCRTVGPLSSSSRSIFSKSFLPLVVVTLVFSILFGRCP